jgi:hypothetical protein
MAYNQFALGENMATAQRERERRDRMLGDDPHNFALSLQNAQANYAGPGWDAFFGSLREQGEAANAQGKNFRVGLGGFGNTRSDEVGGSMPMGQSSWDKTTDRSNAINTYLGELSDQNRLNEERYKQTQAQTALAEAAVRDAARQEQDRASVDRALQTGGQPARAIQQNPDGSYATGAASAPVSPESQRANVLKMLPGHLQPIFQQQWAKQDAAVAKQVEDQKPKLGTPIAAVVDGKRVLVRPGSDGQTYDMTGRPVGGTIAPESEVKAPKPATPAERGVLAYHNRAKQAEDTISGLEAAVRDKGIVGGAVLKWAPNILQPAENQTYRQAQRAFTEARLRKESGAAIPPEEFASDERTYFAQPGDSPAVLEKKRQGRAKVLEGLAFSSGKAYDEFYGEPFGKVGAADAPRAGGASSSKGADPLGIR